MKSNYQHEGLNNIRFYHVVDLIPEKFGVIIRTLKKDKAIDLVILSEKDFFKFKFEAIKWRKRMADPEDRVWPFEVTNEHGCYCYEKDSRLIEARKTRVEKEREKKEAEELQELYRSHGICLSK